MLKNLGCFSANCYWEVLLLWSESKRYKYLHKRCPLVVGSKWANKSEFTIFGLETFCISTFQIHKKEKRKKSIFRLLLLVFHLKCVYSVSTYLHNIRLFLEIIWKTFDISKYYTLLHSNSFWCYVYTVPN